MAAPLAVCTKEKNNFLSRIVTGDETWVHHYEPEPQKAEYGVETLGIANEEEIQE
jgi:hypothetical protein